MINNNLLPWQKETANNFLLNRNFYNSYIICGEKGIGRKIYAKSIASSIFCRSPIKRFSCNYCLSCRLINNETHPDILIINSKNNIDSFEDYNNSLISIKQINELIKWDNKSSFFLNYKIVIINSSNFLNNSASNSLLKILENLKNRTLFLLITNSLDELIPTIISRCKIISLYKPKKIILKNWLIRLGIKNKKSWIAFSCGCPLLIENFINNINNNKNSPIPNWLTKFLHKIKYSYNLNNYDTLEKFENENIYNIFIIIQRIFFDLLLSKNCQKVCYFPELFEEINYVSQKFNKVILSEILKWINKQKILVNYQINKKMFINSILNFLSNKTS